MVHKAMKGSTSYELVKKEGKDKWKILSAPNINEFKKKLNLKYG